MRDNYSRRLHVAFTISKMQEARVKGQGRVSEAEARGITAPTLILWGKDDHLLNPSDAAVLDRLIPNSRAVLIEGSGHIPQLEQREKFKQAPRTEPVSQEQLHCVFLCGLLRGVHCTASYYPRSCIKLSQVTNIFIVLNIIKLRMRVPNQAVLFFLMKVSMLPLSHRKPGISGIRRFEPGLPFLEY